MNADQLAELAPHLADERARVAGNLDEEAAATRDPALRRGIRQAAALVRAMHNPQPDPVPEDDG